MQRLSFIVLVLLTLFFASCSEGEYVNLVKPSSEEIEETKLSESTLECLRGRECDSEIVSKNIQRGKLLNFDLMWENYPGSDYTMEEAKELIGGDINVSWIQNTCTVRLSREIVIIRA